MAYSTIPKGSLYMNNVLYTGNATARNITTPFQPDFTWIKPRSFSENHVLFDAVRGATKRIISNTTDAEATNTTMLTAFNSTSFSIGTNNNVNKNSDTFVAWNWKANGAGSANTAGSINSTVSANTTSGFSIVSWTATNANGATIGHGLGTTPAIVITKRLNSTGDWLVGGSAIDTARGGANSLLLLNSNSAMDSNSEVYQTFSSTTFQVGVNAASFANGATLISYCFVDVKGFSKMGSYTGSASTNGTFVYCGFKPSFILTKATATGEGWQIYDNKRLGVNATEKVLYPNTNSSESTLAGGVDFLSNGFKWRTSDGGVNSSQLYVYMAFAENPFVATSGTSAIPVTAR